VNDILEPIIYSSAFRPLFTGSHGRDYNATNNSVCIVKCDQQNHSGNTGRRRVAATDSNVKGDYNVPACRTERQCALRKSQQRRGGAAHFERRALFLCAYPELSLRVKQLQRYSRWPGLDVFDVSCDGARLLYI